MITFKNTIIAQAISLGFDFSQFEEDSTAEEMITEMIHFFDSKAEQLPQIEDKCEISGNGNRQHVTYGNYERSGEIVDYSYNWHKSPETKVYHSSFLMEEDGVMNNMKLYYLVGETAYNAPEGYYFNEKTKRHEKG